MDSLSEREAPLHSKIEKLRERVFWKNRPRIFADFKFFNDSNDRTNHSESTRVYFPIKSALELEVGGGAVHFKEDGRRDFDGTEFNAGLKWRAGKSWVFEGDFRNRSIAQRHNTQNYGAGVQYKRNANKFRFDWSEKDIDTVRAIEAGIQVKSYSLGYETRLSSPLLMRAGVSYQDYDDGNNGFDLRTGLRYSLPGLKEWRIGADLSYRDSDFEATAYYTPDSLFIGLSRVLYQKSLLENLDFAANFGVGGAP